MSDTRETDSINRFLNARNRAIRAAQQLEGQPGSERLFQREQYLRLEAEHARSEMVRRLKMWAWNEAHDSMCDQGWECVSHRNPYVLKVVSTGN